MTYDNVIIQIEIFSVVRTGNEKITYVTPGGPDTTVTRQGSDSLTDDNSVTELLLDFDTYRSLSPTKFMFPEESKSICNIL